MVLVIKRKFIIAIKRVVAATILAIRGFLEQTIEVKIMLKIKTKEKTIRGIKIPQDCVSL